MNVRLLIEAIVRQMTVLLAELATAGGLRAPLASVADRVFIDLARELESHGISRAVSADMFGLALRTYLRRIRRHDESITDRGVSLWEAVLRFIETQQVASRAEVLERFARDDGDQVRGILQDLTDSGLVYRTGARAGAIYRITTAADTSALRRQTDPEGLDNVLWATIRREGPLRRDALAARVPLDDTTFEAALGRLHADGRIEEAIGPSGVEYRAHSLVLPVGQRAGWEAAVYDHFHAVVKTILCKLRQDADSTRADDRIGGSTYGFEVWEGHPLRNRVLDQLAQFRRETTALRREVDAYNQAAAPPRRKERVTVYMGQSWVAEEDEEEEDEEEEEEEEEDEA